jgi:uncharacterized membrane protein YjgN (DUF898 family)
VEHEQQTITTHDFQFTGNGSEYFRIWIVNLCLSILTLGVYSAWAKVRNTQYLYGNTRVNDAPFEYLAEPVNILKGRFIAVAVFVLYSVIGQTYPAQQPVFMLLLLPFLPLVIIRSMCFRLHNTAYRNIRFKFSGRYGEAARVFILLPLLVPLTLGFIYPYWKLCSKKFIVNNAAFGNTPFALNINASPFYTVYFRLLGLFVVVGLAFVLLSSLMPQAGVFVLPPLGFIFYCFLLAYVNAEITNLVFNHTSLDKHGFHSELQVKPLFFLYLTNGLAIMLSLGLMIPWAQVRAAQYRAQCTELNAAGSMDNFVAVTQQKVSALGEEFGEAFDLEIGL